MITYSIEYEIPPLRAIYQAELDVAQEEPEGVLVAFIKSQQPLWRVRKINGKPLSAEMPHRHPSERTDNSH
jgi:hypothetical protein